MAKAMIVKEGQKYIFKLCGSSGEDTVIYTSQSYYECHAFAEHYIKYYDALSEEGTPTPICKGCGSHFIPQENEKLCPSCAKVLKRLGDYVAPVRHGHWLGKPTGRYEVLKCSVCGDCAPTAGLMPRFCPNCGAKLSYGKVREL